VLATKIVSGDGISYNLTPLGYVVLIAVVIVMLAVGFIVKDKKTHSVKRLVTSAMAIALATLTSFITIFKMPMGGSVTLFSMLFIVLIGYWYGISAGMTASIAYGVLQLIVNPYIISLPQMFLDYIFAFGALGLSGIFTNSKNGLVKGYIAGIAGRFFFSFLSGWIFFAVYTPEFFNSAVLYSLAYNAAYIGAEGIITIIVIMLPPVKKAILYVKQTSNE
jgi:thiamine transporter